ncbi:DDE domain-containing protein [Natronincola peptidivorans]|uniref:DDE domain-containing protein n=1 Tax=Natronincola peptidivorans TaxID=426128 RepID=A0A1I0B285_9FIRM|nr:DDE-type integrase/transposase/recombinase [Natronincola peptidivorans]SET00852.1 DDE domain-containing protein [Natronincola peptidivorans]
MNSIITYLLVYIQYLHKEIFNLTLFIAKYIPLKQWAFNDAQSPECQKFKIDKLPRILKFEKHDYRFLLAYYKHHYGKDTKPVNRRNGRAIPENIFCARCDAPHHYLYDNNGGNGRYQCKVCGQTFKTGEVVKRPLVLMCPHCSHTLVPRKDRKHFRVHKCTNKKCSYYLSNLRKLPKDLAPEDKHKYKLHYIYREFTMDFFKMHLHALPNWATNFKFKRQNPHVMGLCLTYHVNLGLSLRKTSQALKEIHNISISHAMVASYAKTAFVADGYSAYPLASQQFAIQEDKLFDITQVIGLTNDDPISKEFRSLKQKIERLDRTFKASYRVTCGYGSDDGAAYGVSLWVTYYNFLRPHDLYRWRRPLNQVDMLDQTSNMPGKWQLLIFLGQQTILNMQQNIAV